MNQSSRLPRPRTVATTGAVYAVAKPSSSPRDALPDIRPLLIAHEENLAKFMDLMVSYTPMDLRAELCVKRVAAERGIRGATAHRVMSTRRASLKRLK